MKIFLPVLLFALVGCQSVEETRLQRSVGEKLSQQIQEFVSADADQVVAKRLQEGNTKFLGFAGTATEPSFVPGLSQTEIRDLTAAKQYQWEIFYYYHGRSALGSAAQEKALWDARVDYASRVNRRLLEELKRQPGDAGAAAASGRRA